MKTILSSQRVTNLLAIFASLQILAVIYYTCFLYQNSYLPEPFIFDKGDTLMDFYNPLYWSADDGRYNVWGSIYPPLNFVVLSIIRIVFIGTGNLPGPFNIREQNNLLSILFVFSAFATCYVIIFSRLFVSVTNKQKGLLFIGIALSPPFLFAVERGNLVLLALPLLALILLTRDWKRSLCIALIINLKPYFVLLLLVYLIKGRLEWFIMTAALAGAIFVFTGLIVDPQFLSFLTNSAGFQSVMDATHPGNFMSMAASIDVLRYALDYWFATGIDFSGFESDIVALSSILKILLIVIVLVAIAVSFLAGRSISYAELFLMVVLISINSTLYVGGYSLIFLVPFLPTIWNLRLASFALVFVAIIFIPLDWIPVLTARNWEVGSFLAGHPVTVLEVIGIGAFVRPLADLALLVVLVVEFSFRYIELKKADWLRFGASAKTCST